MCRMFDSEKHNKYIDEVCVEIIKETGSMDPDGKESECAEKNMKKWE